MKYWSAVELSEDNMLGLVGHFIPRCAFHEDVQMGVQNCKALSFSLFMDDINDSHALDVVLSCPVCGYIEIFGVAISAEHRQKITNMIDKKREDGIGEHKIHDGTLIDRDQENDSWMEVYR